MMGRKGLFGRNMGFQTPGIGDGLPGMPERLPDMASVPTTAGGVFGNAMPAEAPPRQVGAGWKNVLLNALGGAADGAATFFGGQPLIAQSRQFERLQAERLAAEQRQRAAELADYESKLQIKQRYEQPEGPELGTFEDNAGNVWSYDKRTNQVVGDKPFFIDQAQRTMIQDGALIRVPNPFASQGGGQQSGPQPGAIEDGYRFKGGNPSDPNSWEPVGGAGRAPAASARGARRITQAEYQRILRSMGGDQRRMNAYMANQNIIVGN